MQTKLLINDRCISCDSCRQICPQNSVLTDGKKYAIDNWSCSDCDLCKKVCPSDAIVTSRPSDQKN